MKRHMKESTMTQQPHLPDAEREYFFVSTDRDDDRNLVQANHVENLTLDNVRIVTSD